MLNYFLNLLKDLILNLLYLLRLKKRIEPKKDENQMYLITVNYNIKKLNSGQLKIGLNKESKIEDAKQIIVNELNKLLLIKFNDESNLLKPKQIAIIFQGNHCLF